MYCGDGYVPLRQAPPHAHDVAGDAHASRQRARGRCPGHPRPDRQPSGNPTARRELVDVLADAAWTGRPDFPRMEPDLAHDSGFRVQSWWL
jgi:hypothetical protein